MSAGSISSVASNAVDLIQSAAPATKGKLDMVTALAKQALDGDKTALQLVTVATDASKGQQVDMSA